MLYGNVGAGKTMLLNSLIRLFREVGYWHPKLFAGKGTVSCLLTIVFVILVN